jgi:hypothetical protein
MTMASFPATLSLISEKDPTIFIPHEPNMPHNCSGPSA